MSDQRGRLLAAALGFAGCSMPSYDRALQALRTRLDSWSSIGRIAVGMARQGHDLQLTRYDERGWRATFYQPAWSIRRRARPTGWELTPWEADEELHVLLERAAKLMVKAGYRAYSVRIKVAGKEKGYGLMESSFYLDMVMKHRNPPQK
jgi:hypothetical protein